MRIKIWPVNRPVLNPSAHTRPSPKSAMARVARTVFLGYCGSGLTCSILDSCYWARLGAKVGSEEKFYGPLLNIAFGALYGAALGAKLGFGWPLRLMRQVKKEQAEEAV